MSIYLSFFLYKEAYKIPSPSHCLINSSWNVSNQWFLFRVFIEDGLALLDIKSLMIAANLTLYEMILLIIELFIILIRKEPIKQLLLYRSRAK